MKQFIVLFIFSTTFLLGCNKKQITQAKLAGNWKFSEYTYVEINNEPGDSSQSFSKTEKADGFLNLDASGNGTANWPIMHITDPLSIYYNDSLPVMFESPIRCLINTGEENLNSADFSRSDVQYGDVLQFNKVVFMKLLSKNKLSLTILDGVSWKESKSQTRIIFTK
jgi:hypothetical protein